MTDTREQERREKAEAVRARAQSLALLLGLPLLDEAKGKVPQ